VGYGASFGGLAALLAMLNSCATGIAVVNIDNGFGAGYLAALINRQDRFPAMGLSRYGKGGVALSDQASRSGPGISLGLYADKK
jgi:hypothetical protein